MDEPACIPVVSLGEALDERSPHAYEVAHDIGHAMVLAGAFYVCDHGIPERVLAQPFATARALFALPAPQQFGLVREVRGPLPPQEGPADWFGCCSLRSVEGGGRLACAPRSPAPPWLQHALARYETEMARLARRLLQLLALSLDRPRDTLCSRDGAALRLVRLLRYPALPPGVVQTGAQAHTDGCALTLLAQDGHPGLEVDDGGGRWSPVQPRPGALLVHLGDRLGDRLGAWSGGRYRALRHRVRRTDGHAEARLSVPFFFTPLDPPAG